MSSSAKVCPRCGFKRRVGQASWLSWTVVGFLMFAVISSAASRTSSASSSVSEEPKAADQKTPSRDSTPGITRIGAKRAAQMWKDVPTNPGMGRSSCDEAYCEVSFDPSLWVRMTYDQKRDFVAMMGIE